MSTHLICSCGCMRLRMYIRNNVHKFRQAVNRPSTHYLKYPLWFEACHKNFQSLLNIFLFTIDIQISTSPSVMFIIFIVPL